MKFFKYHAKAARSRSVAAPALLLFLLAALVALALGSSAGAVATPVPLGTADPFAVLGGSTVTNTGPSVITGNLGVSPGSAVTGFPPGLVIGTIHAADAVALQAQTDTTTAYNNAAGQGPTSPITADLGGQTLVAGVYNSASSIGLTGTLTLDGQSDPSSVWVFQAGSTLITASGSNVSLINGAQSCNVFWQVGSSATLGTGSSFVGTILALTSITVTTGVTVDGRVLARNGAVTLDTDVITKSTCGVVQPPPPPPAPPPPPPPAPPPPPPPAPPPPPPPPCHHGTGPLDPNPNSHVGPGTDFYAMLQAISNDLAARPYTGATATRRNAALGFISNALIASRWSTRGSPDTSDEGKAVLSQMLMGFKYLTTPNITLCETAADLRADLIVLAGRIAAQRFAEVVAAPGGSASLENQAGDSMANAAGNPMTQVALEQYLRVISLLKNEQPQFT